MSKDNLFKGLRKKLLSKQSGAFFYMQTKAGGVAIVGYASDEPNVIIPSTIDGKYVTDIAEGAFCEQDGVVCVQIPNTVSNIERRAFDNNENLLAITLPADLKNIAPDAFTNCPNLIITVVPDTYGERYCQAQQIDYSYVLDEGIFTGFQSDELDDGIVILDYFYTDPEVKIPSQLNGKPVTTIGKEAFKENEDIISVVIPDSVTEIDDWAFHGCKSLEAVVFSKNLRRIGKNAFSHCYRLKKLDIPKSVRSICPEAFEMCDGLENVSMPEGIDTIEEKTFWGCRSLKAIVIPNSVRNICEEAFACCKSLKSIIISNEFYHIGDRAFSGTGLENIKVPFAEKYGEGVFELCPELKTVILPQNLTVIPTSMFACCKALHSISIPESVTCIMEAAFVSCSFESIDLPNSITHIQKRAFDRCDKLKYLTIPGSVACIPAEVAYFNDDSTEHNIIVSEGVKELENNAFDCLHTHTIQLPSSLTTIADRALSMTKNVTAYVVQGSLAEKYCKNKGIKFAYIR